MDQDWTVLRIERSDLVAIELNSPDPADIRGVISVFPTRYTQWAVRSRDWRPIRRQKSHAQPSMSGVLRVAPASMPFLDRRPWKWIFAPPRRQSCNGSMLFSGAQ